MKNSTVGAITKMQALTSEMDDINKKAAALIVDVMSNQASSATKDQLINILEQMLGSFPQESREAILCNVVASLSISLSGVMPQANNTPYREVTRGKKGKKKQPRFSYGTGDDDYLL